MNEIEFYDKIGECISKFKNGRNRYMESPLFNKVIQMLARDCDQIEIIDQLITMNEDTQKVLEEYIHRDTKPNFIIL